ncbi:MAG TPA: hypothetical protein P5186_03340 [Candidatus Paceibacterota bacterium]|nr:hypothetical protein [Candidatus Paceibacterota bacterium]
MRPRGYILSRFARLSGTAVIAALLGLFACQSQAELKHRYSFDNEATDSIGNANGTVQGSVFVADGVAYFPGVVNTDYIELPPGLISNYTTVSFEFWANVYDNGTWTELFAFGNQTAGGEGANMVMFCPHSGSSPADFRMSYAQAAPGYNDERVVNGVGILDNAGLVSVACVYDPPNNSMSLYTNGTLVGTLSPVTTGAKVFSLTNVINTRSWLGRSLYNGDAPYNGTIEEFRIYDKPLTPLQVYVNNMAGPNTIVDNIAINSLSWNVKPSMVVGSRQSTTVTFNTANYGSVTLPNATEPSYASGDPSIVTVTAQGQIFAMAVGSATVSATFNGTTNSVEVVVSAPQLMHRYTFNENANDSVGNAHGTLLGGATVSGGSLNLAGGTSSSDPAAPHLNLPNDLLTNVTAVTIEAWVTDNGSANWARVWDLGNSAGGEDVSDTGSRYLFLALPNDGNNVQGNIHINDRGGDASVTSPSGTRPAVGQEAHVVWSSDIANRTSWLYVNGALVAVNNNTTVSPADIGRSVNNWLGRSQYGSDPAFIGSINEFRIYNGAVSPLQVSIDAASGPNQIITDPGPVQALRLTMPTNAIYYGGPAVGLTVFADFANINNVNVTTAPGIAYQSSDPKVLTVSGTGMITGTGLGTATVTANYNGKTGTVSVTVSSLPGYYKASLAHRYSFSESSGTTVKDSVGTADGTIKGLGATFDGKGQLSLPGGTSSSADPTAISGYVDLPNNTINVLTDLSIETWITWEGSGSWQRIFDFGTSAGGEDISDGNGGYLFLAPQGSANLTFSVRDPELGSEPAPLIAPAPLTPGVEVYLAVAYDQTANVARLYSNAVLVASSTAPVAIPTLNDVNNWLGRSQWGDPMFQGKFNEFRIWNGVLMPDEVATHYAAGPDAFEVVSVTLTATLSGQNLVISWPASAAGFALQSTALLGSGANWTAVATPPTTADGVNSVTVPVTGQAQFFRLIK